MTKSTILDDDAIAEIEAMFPHAEYQPTLSPDEVDPCEFCKGTIDDHKANCVVPHVHALCQTVRALKAENERLKRQLGQGEKSDVFSDEYAALGYDEKDTL